MTKTGLLISKNSASATAMFGFFNSSGGWVTVFLRSRPMQHAPQAYLGIAVQPIQRLGVAVI